MAWCQIGDKSLPMLARCITPYDVTKVQIVEIFQMIGAQLKERNPPKVHSIYIHYEMWDEITYPFPHSNGTTVEVWEWLSNVIPNVTWYVITYPCWD